MRRRLFALVSVLLLAVGIAAAPDAVADRLPTTTTYTGPTSATVGVATTLTASVTPSSVPGYVSFDSNLDLLGTATVSGGVASLPWTFTSVGTTPIHVSFTPTDTVAYQISGPPPVDVSVSAAAPPGSSTPPGSSGSPGASGSPAATRLAVTASSFVASAGDLVTFTAKVTAGPGTPTGTVAFWFPDLGTGQTSPLSGGTASAIMTVPKIGVPFAPIEGLASFTPSDATKFTASTGSGLVLASNPAPADPQKSSGLVQVVNTVMSGSTPCAPSYMVAYYTTGLQADVGISWISAAGKWLKKILKAWSESSADSMQALMSQMPELGNVQSAHATIDSSSTCFSIDGVRAAGNAAKVAAGAQQITVPCIAIKTGYMCLGGQLPAGAKFTLSADVPIPAALAGKKVTIGATASANAVGGSVKVLASKKTQVKIAKKTALVVSLKSSANTLTPKEKISYTLTLKNAGIIAATKLRACLSLSAGATAAKAKGLTVKGQQVCFAAASLKPGKRVSTKIKVTAPGRAGTLKATAVVSATPAPKVKLVSGVPVVASGKTS